MIDNESVFKIDFIIAQKDPFSMEQFNRRQTKDLAGIKIDVISPEDLILAKLLWARESAHRPDTLPEIQKIYDEKIRALDQADRFLKGLSLTHFCRELSMAGIRDRNPSITPKGLKIQLFNTVYGSLFSTEEKKRITSKWL